MIQVYTQENNNAKEIELSRDKEHDIETLVLHLKRKSSHSYNQNKSFCIGIAGAIKWLNLDRLLN